MLGASIEPDCAVSLDDRALCQQTQRWTRPLDADTAKDALPVYEDAASLQALLTHYREDVPALESLQARLQAQVLRQHCYEHRAFELGVLLSRWLGYAD